MKEEPLFHQALDQPADRRGAFLDAACGADADLRERVEMLLRAHANPGSFLDLPPPGLVATIDTPPLAERPGTTIGRYKLLEEIGEGGMGVVYMAKQQEPVRRKVALKIIKPGMDTREVIARFEAERQALAMMDHPNIAKVFDAGETESGRSYFVMELVRGIPLTDYCDQNELTTRERLELFVQVCQAVHHAHQKGVIHRDLKPSNVMVTLYDGVPVPKIIDFGIAKATDGHLTERAVSTNYGQIIGTPLYMSPEQAEISGLDVDPRSDIYSLGVVLYELLAGNTPFDGERVREAGYDEIRRMIREDEPQQPSARISTLGAAATTVSAHRKTDPAKLSSLLRRDLDWIVMKALEKDPARRYQTATDFARDIRHYLSDEPIEARRPTVLDRAGRWARRHRPRSRWAMAAGLAAGAAAVFAFAFIIIEVYKGGRTTTLRAPEGSEITVRPSGDVEVKLPTPDKNVAVPARIAAEYARRGDRYAMAGDFDKALAEYSEALRLDPGVTDYYSHQAIASLAVGKIDLYRKTARAMLEHFTAIYSPWAAAEVAQACAFGPDAVTDWPKVVALAGLGGRYDPTSAWCQRGLEMILYRAGRFEEALRHLNEATAFKGEPSERWVASPAERWYFRVLPAGVQNLRKAGRP